MRISHLPTKLLSGTIALAILVSGFIQMPIVNAATTNWMAGHIISDSIMSTNPGMSVGDIQNFLESKVTCDTNGTKTSELGGGTRAQYGNARGFTTPFVCLPGYFESTTSTYTVKYSYKNTSGTTKSTTYTYTANNYYKITGFTVTYNNGNYRNGIQSVKPKYTNVNGVKPSGAKSAATLIYNVSQTYNINPQVLIVLLQKEQGLVTDEWPSPTQYYSATGYACTDSAPCDPKYANFYSQIKAAATMFRAILNNSPDWYTPYETGQEYVQYNPVSSCGGSTISIDTRATQALYNYTPYQPNAATLAASAGTTVNCGAYGNLNFYRYFTSWFGSTRAGWTNWSDVSDTISWSETAAPSISFNANRDFIIAALTSTGELRVRYGTASGNWSNWTTHSGGSNWSQTTIGYDKNGNPRIFAIDKAGAMYYRYKKSSGWTAWARVAGGSDWSTTAAPNVSFSSNGDFIISALTKDGTLMVRYGSFGGKWSNWTTHAGASNWSQAMVGYGKNNVPRIFAIDKTGVLNYRYKKSSGWTAWARVAGGSDWSTTAAPSISFQANGDFIISAVKNTGVLQVRYGSFGGKWSNWNTHAGGANWSQGVVGYDKKGNPRLFAVDKINSIYYRYKAK